VLRLRRPRDPSLLARRLAAGLLAVAALALAVRPATPGPPGGVAAAVPVVVATADLPPGTTLAGGDLRIALFPPALRPAGSSAAPAALGGRVLAAAVRRGEPLTDVRLLGAGLTALLAPGQVAAPVRLADLAVTGLVRAGDRVDVLAATEGAEQAERVAAGALVLAAPARAAPEADAGAVRPASGSAPDGLLLLAVDPATAARLAAASAAATLTVTLSAPPGR
jgi:Flp pilus assembly protein CpaB